MRFFGLEVFVTGLLLSTSLWLIDRISIPFPDLPKSKESGIILPLDGPSLGELYQTNNLTGTIRFAVIGDYGTGDSDEAAVADLVKSWKPDFIITTGDNNYPDGEASTIDQNIGQFFHEFIWPYKGAYSQGGVVTRGSISTLEDYPYNIYLPIIHKFGFSTNRFFPSLGNHDWHASGAAPYLDYFTLPGNERYYNFVRGPVHFFALDSDGDEPYGNSSDSIQGVWLQNKLAASVSCWNLVYFHHPSYSSGRHGSSAVMQWPFAAWGADGVLTGHDHLYERIVRNGFPYFVNGLGGRSIYSFRTPIPGSEVRYNDQHGAMIVVASPTEITYQFIAVDGTIVDTYSQVGGCPN
jgi:hypothetical protein